MNRYNRIYRILLTVITALSFAACEDQPPTDYIPVPYLEAYLMVGEPIDNVVVAISQPLTQKFDYSSMMASDAEVVINANGIDYPLVYGVRDGVGRYLFPDTTYRVLPDTRYSIRVRMADGEIMKAETITPGKIGWTVPPRSVIQYPQDTTQLFSPDSLRIAWTTGGASEFIIRVTVLDTLGYGTYLQPPTEEINERTNNLPFEDPEDPPFYTKTRWGFIQTNQAPTVWAAFRWYGRNEVAILAPDKALLDWFKATQWGGRSVEFRPEYSNVNGGIGVFGSAAVAAKEIFLLKRK
ncbi:MAG: DUF4249 family protein [Bacteroidetes bacterium]|nr:DUF4249 family protein [Bacteroidota bacterium]